MDQSLFDFQTGIGVGASGIFGLSQSTTSLRWQNQTEGWFWFNVQKWSVAGVVGTLWQRSLT